MAPFGLFKKKERSEEIRTEHPAITIPEGESLSISQAQAILQQLEASGLQALSSRLAPIRTSVLESLKALGTLAADMEHEKIKLEGLEQRFKSLVENSRKTLVASLRRESTTELELPKSVNDVKKFKERFESLLSRFGEVSGSHSKILNNFMKKQAAPMKQEFENLQELFAEAKSAISDFDRQRAPVVKCSELLNTASQKVSSLQNSVASAEGYRKEIALLREEISRMGQESEALRSTKEYQEAESASLQLGGLDLQLEDLRKNLVEQFSRISRALSKYSYGVSKETERRLNLMLSEPWQLLSTTDGSSYLALLGEVRKSITSGGIQLKDSEKMVQYIDSISLLLPDLRNRHAEINSKIEDLKRRDLSVFYRAREIENKLNDTKERLTRSNDSLQILQRQNEEKKTEVDALFAEASSLVSSITGQKCSIKS